MKDVPWVNVSVGSLHFFLGRRRSQSGFSKNKYWREYLWMSRPLFQIHRFFGYVNKRKYSVKANLGT